MSSHNLSTRDLFSRLSSLLEYIMQSKSRAQVLAFLRTHLDPCGVPVDVMVANLDKDGEIKTELAFAETSFGLIPESISIVSSSPIAIALRELRVYFDGFADATESLELSKRRSSGLPWNGKAVYVPTSIFRVYGFAFQCQSNLSEEFCSYVNYVRSIVIQRERFNEQSSQKVLTKVETQDSSFTQRQELVLGLLRQGKTNAYIASKLGFSESLIRQETIIIYRKLGIKGRKDIMQSNYSLVAPTAN